MYELKVVTHFAAAHQLSMVGAKCENLHGHNWKIEVYVTGDKLDEAETNSLKKLYKVGLFLAKR